MKYQPTPFLQTKFLLKLNKTLLNENIKIRIEIDESIKEAQRQLNELNLSEERKIELVRSLEILENYTKQIDEWKKEHERIRNLNLSG